MKRDITLASLAMLKVKINSGEDYLEYFRPFVIHALSPMEIGDHISDIKVSDNIREIFGLEIPPRTSQIILQRLAREKLLKKEYGRYKIVEKIQDANSLTQEKSAAERKITAVANNLVKFSQENYKKNISEEEAMEAISLFLSKFSVSCLKSFLRGTALPNDIDAKNWKLVLVSAYLGDIEKNQPSTFEDFLLIVKGHMLANALLCPDLDLSSKTYNDVIFYLDTPVLLQLINLDSHQKKQAAEELINQLHRLGAKISFFSHTLEELQNTITSSAEYIDSPDGRGSIVYESRKSGLKKSDLLLIAEDAQEQLEELGVSYRPTPPYSEKYQIDEEEFAALLTEAINYSNPKAVEYDVNSARSIFNLRKGAQPNKIENCKAVLITSNTEFANAAFDYGKKIERSPEVSSVITDFSIANIAWLKAPMGAPLLPQKEVMAFAYATIRPTDDFLHQVIAEADKLESSGKISARDHQLLRSSAHAQQALQNLTLGEEEELNEVSITRALEITEEAIKKEETDKLELEKKAHNQAAQDLAAERERIQQVAQQLYWNSEKKANFAIGIIYTLLLIALGIGLGSQLLPTLSARIPHAFYAALLASSFVTLIFGYSINQWKTSLSNRFKSYLFKSSLKKFGLTDTQFNS